MSAFSVVSDCLLAACFGTEAAEVVARFPNHSFAESVPTMFRHHVQVPAGSTEHSTTESQGPLAVDELSVGTIGCRQGSFGKESSVQAMPNREGAASGKESSIQAVSRG